MLYGAGVVLVLNMANLFLEDCKSQCQELRLTEGKLNGETGAESDGRKDKFFRKIAA